MDHRVKKMFKIRTTHVWYIYTSMARWIMDRIGKCLLYEQQKTNSFTSSDPRHDISKQPR